MTKKPRFVSNCHVLCNSYERNKIFTKEQKIYKQGLKYSKKCLVQLQLQTSSARSSPNKQVVQAEAEENETNSYVRS